MNYILTKVGNYFFPAKNKAMIRACLSKPFEMRPEMLLHAATKIIRGARPQDIDQVAVGDGSHFGLPAVFDLFGHHVLEHRQEHALKTHEGIVARHPVKLSMKGDLVLHPKRLLFLV